MEGEPVILELTDDQAQFVLNALRLYVDKNRHSWPDHFVAFAEKIVATAQAAVHT